MSWDTYAVCSDCGWFIRAPFGMLFHVHREVCGGCGASKYDSMSVRIARKIRRRLFGPTELEFREDQS